MNALTERHAKYTPGWFKIQNNSPRTSIPCRYGSRSYHDFLRLRLASSTRFLPITARMVCAISCPYGSRASDDCGLCRFAGFIRFTTAAAHVPLSIPSNGGSRFPDDSTVDTARATNSISTMNGSRWNSDSLRTRLAQ